MSNGKNYHEQKYKTNKLTVKKIFLKMLDGADMDKRTIDNLASDLQDEFLKHLRDGLLDGDKVIFNNLFTAILVDTPERPGRNPRTGESYLITKRRKLKTKVLAEFKSQLKKLA